MKVVNDSDEKGGLAQDGKYCFTGVTYSFKGKIKLLSGDKQLTVENCIAKCVAPKLSYTEYMIRLETPIRN